MNKKINKKIVLFAILGILIFGASTASAQTLSGALNQLRIVAQTIVVSIAIIGWVITSILFLTSAGNPAKINTAKLSLIACIIGTVLAILAYNDTFWAVIQDALAI